MACISCSTKFNIFHKEFGCENCGRSFCKKCLIKKCKIPGPEDTSKTICRKCFLTIASGKKQDATSIPPPDIFLKRLESLSSPAVKPITMYRNDSTIGNLKSGLTGIDQEIAARLERLKEEKKVQQVTDDELRSRLANLKGVNEQLLAPANVQHIEDTRSDQEKVSDLLEQYMHETDLEQKDPSDPLRERLDKLKGQEGATPKSADVEIDDSSSDSEKDAVQLAKRFVREATLDEQTGGMTSTVASEPDVANEEELPWCVLCNEDATERCIGCDGDLYCRRCFKEAHKDFDYTDHKKVPFRHQKR